MTKNCPEENHPEHNVAALERAQATDSERGLYKTMLEKDGYFAGCMATVLDRYNCDILLLPTLSSNMQVLAAKARSPALSVPMGIYPKKTQVENDPKNGLITTALGIP